MASTAAALLDELMGRDRNLAPTEKRKEIKWDDPSVCKYFLVDFCPHELFVNTRADLGPCNKLHEEDLRKNYQKSRHCGQMGYEEDFMRFLQTLVADVEKRIRRGHARLALNNAAQQNSVAGVTQAAKQEKIEMLTKKINDLVEKAEELGCEGKVEEAQGMMMLCEKLKEERNDLESGDRGAGGSEHRGEGSSKDMEVCDVCGALLIVGDAQQRIDEHIMGKQHMGYARIRTYLLNRDKSRRRATTEEREEREKERVKKEKEEEDAREAEREKEREERRRKEKEEREKEETREKERRRKRSHSRTRSRRSRSRSRSRRGKRSRSRDRRRRSRSRSRHRRRSKSSHRSRSRTRSRRSSRDRRRSRSRERRKSHSRSRSRKDKRSRDRSRSKDRKSRSRRSRSRGKRSHSRSKRSRDKRSRSRDKRSRSRDKRSRSRDKRSRSRDKRSRSRDKRSRSRDKRSRSNDKRSHSRDKSSPLKEEKKSEDIKSTEIKSEEIKCDDKGNGKMEMDEVPERQENGMGDAPIAKSEVVMKTEELPGVTEGKDSFIQGKSSPKISPGDQTDMQE